MSEPSSLTFGSREDRKAVENGLAVCPEIRRTRPDRRHRQDADTGEVLMVAYMNEESLGLTIEKGEAVYFSRSRQKLWHKGATSGHVQTVERILTDCDQDALVLKVRQHGPGCCHAGYRSCFYRRVESPVTGEPVPLGPEILEKAYDPDAVYGH
jgi:phosphoribosyl-AMP cyclohydrolase